MNSQNTNGLKKLLEFLNKLDEQGIGYSMEHNREETLTVFVALPGERWEVEFYSDGEIDVEVFYSGAEEDDLEGEEALERLFSNLEDYEEDDEEDDEDEEFEDEDLDEDDEEDEDFDDDEEENENDRR